MLIADLAALVALYYLIAHGPSRLKPVGLGVALVGGAVVASRASIPGVLDKPLIGTIVVSAEVLVAALLADRRVSRRERLVALEIERDQQAELGAAQERARIARELHDVVAHSLAVMVAQADGGRYAAADGSRRGARWSRSPTPAARRSSRCASCSACCARGRSAPTCRASSAGWRARGCRSSSRSRAPSGRCPAESSCRFTASRRRR